MSRRLATLDRYDRKTATAQRNILPLPSRRGLISNGERRKPVLISGSGDWRSRWAAIAAVLIVGVLYVIWVVHLTPAREHTGAPQCVIDDRPVTCPYDPSQFRTAYGIEPLLRQGIDGRGRTVVLYEKPVPADGAPHASNIYQDLAAYDQRYGLPTASLRVYSGFARSANPALADMEEVLDAEVVHAVAPQAKIEMLLADDNDFLPALRYALTHQLGDVIYFSIGLGEPCFSSAQAAALHAVTEFAAAQSVTLVASSGDYGAVSEPCQPTTTASAVTGVSLPASDPLVTAVGGTRLVVQLPSGGYRSETAWNSPPPSRSAQTRSARTPWARTRSGPPRIQQPPAAGLATCSPAPTIRFSCPAPPRAAGCPMWPPTLTRPPASPSSPCSTADLSRAAPAGPALVPPYGQGWSP
jgi:hypothetical protein